ncbi:NEFA interacting nuclear protein NIP30 N terminal [Paragonimus heterotremus]|uniref:NEFA interacting nuclear protein NIP30 N terminal n=1 Tax=Paragonimus heterotremus TaxID=100268 RepID=A0A8J4X3C6_9TREM|nr:NEFA interacting nuclear protein NIP30 N terminal [Paragonimus heterotremus]
MSGLNKRFISEKDAEARKKAQEAEGVVEEPYDARSLYDRLQIEKNRKQEEYEAQAALKNRIHRLDEEEVEYLQTLAVKKHQVDLENEKEVSALLKEAQISFSVYTRSLKKILQSLTLIALHTVRPTLSTASVSCETQSKAPVARSGPTQRSLLANAVKRPSHPTELISGSKPKRPNTEGNNPPTEAANIVNGTSSAVDRADSPNSPTESGPGLINYSDSDSTVSTDSESESTDVEDAACTLLEVAATRLRKAKSPTSEES